MQMEQDKMPMAQSYLSRRDILRVAGGLAVAVAGGCVGAAPAAGAAAAEKDAASDEEGGRRGAQRLGLRRLKQFESLGYGMFISFDIQAFVSATLHGEKVTEEQRRIPAAVYAPEKLDVGQWVAVARDAGMKYAVLTAKRIPGFCLWPSMLTDYTVAHSSNKTDVVEQYVKACEKCGVQPGLYYSAIDLHHLGGRSIQPPSDWKYTTSLYQTFMTNQITELLTGYGAIPEVWIDIPIILGRGYRTFLYQHIARLQPNAVIMMNLGLQGGSQVGKCLDKFWPSDLISIERHLPPEAGHRKWWTIEGNDYYLPGEVCDSIMEKSWWWKEGEKPRPDRELLAQFEACRQRGVNYLLDAPPDNHGVIPPSTVEALMRLRRNARI